MARSYTYCKLLEPIHNITILYNNTSINSQFIHECYIELDAIADATESQDALIGILGAAGGLTLCCLLVFVPVCHQ